MMEKYNIMKKYNVINIIRRHWRGFKRIFNGRKISDHILFTDDMVCVFADRHRELQAVIAIVSNYRAGVDIESGDYRPRGIYKAEGGVIVDGRDIVIIRSYGIIKCYDDFDDNETDIPKIVKEVVEEILSIEKPDPLRTEDTLIEYAVKNTDTSEEILRKSVGRFVGNPFGGDSLRRLFQS